MAKLVYAEKSAGGKIRFRVPYCGTDGQRKEIRLAKIKRREAESLAIKIRELASVRAAGDALPPHLVEWARTLRADIRLKLVNAGLLDPVKTAGLKQWLDDYIAERSDVKPATATQYRQTRSNLLAKFDGSRELQTITPQDAAEWRRWMLASGNTRDRGNPKLSEATVRRRTGRAKQFFAEAVTRGYITSNPFELLPSASRGNEARQQFIEQAVIQSVLDSLPAGDWQTIIALARFGGLRIPSELAALRWTDVCLDRGRLRISSPKTEHHTGGGIRSCPLFPELRPYIEAARARQRGGCEFVIEDPRYRHREANLGTQFARILAAAGVERWPRLFQNLRASRETELLAQFATRDVTSWLGNSAAVAMEHYAMESADSFALAAGLKIAG